jgi:hypothetical protein
MHTNRRATAATIFSRAAAALDHRTSCRHLVRAVDVHGEGFDVVQVDERDAVTAQAFGGPLRARHGAADPVPGSAQLVDEEVRGRPAADADERVIDDVLQRRAGDGLLHLVLGHRRLRSGGF